MVIAAVPKSRLTAKPFAELSFLNKKAVGNIKSVPAIKFATCPTGTPAMLP